MCKQINTNSFKNQNTDKLISDISCIFIKMRAKTTDVRLRWSYCTTWNPLTVCKQIINRIIPFRLQFLKPFYYVQNKTRSSSFKNLENNICLQITYI